MDHSIYIYGMKFPNRLFVGGLSKFAEAKELADFFEFFGTVIDAKIIMNKQGASKGYGFVTFSGKTDVENVIKQGQLFFQGKKLNIGPAVRKQTPDAPGETVVVVQHPISSGAHSVTKLAQPSSPPALSPIQPQIFFNNPPVVYRPPFYGYHY